MDKISALIGRRMGAHDLREASLASQVVHAANQILMEDFKADSKEVKALTFKQGTLLIAVKNSLWAEEVRGMTLELQEKILKKVPLKTPLKIRTKSLTFS